MSHPYRIEDTWCEQIPLLHRILVDPVLVSDFPRPSAMTSVAGACPVWETLHYALRALLGWDKPGLGLAWWYAQGKPVDDSTLLRTVSEMWNREQELDFYAAWAWTQEMEFPNTKDRSASRLAHDSLFFDEQWWRAFTSRSKPSWRNPFYGGTNPLHLGHSDWFGFDEPEADRSELHFDLSTRRAVLVVNNLGSWRHDLQKSEYRLPELGTRSWHVKVFDQQFGYLGLFRRSRETGRWFQGKHHIHTRGNKQQTAEHAT